MISFLWKFRPKLPIKLNSRLKRMLNYFQIKFKKGKSTLVMNLQGLKLVMLYRKLKRKHLARYRQQNLNKRKDVAEKRVDKIKVILTNFLC